MGLADRAIFPFRFPCNSFSFKSFELGDPTMFFFTFLEHFKNGNFILVDKIVNGKDDYLVSLEVFCTLH